MSETTEFRCKYCSRSFISNRSRSRHIRRCNLNPDHKPVWNKGLTKETSSIIRNASIASSTTKKNTPKPVSLYKEHNDDQINEWVKYLDSLHVSTPQLITRENQGYKILVGNCHKHTSGTHFKSEQHYLMELVFNCDLPRGCVIHHIDENKLNNSLNNLMVFKTIADHVRFHNSRTAYLIYDKITHVFTCENTPQLPNGRVANF